MRTRAPVLLVALLLAVPAAAQTSGGSPPANSDGRTVGVSPSNDTQTTFSPRTATQRCDPRTEKNCGAPLEERYMQIVNAMVKSVCPHCLTKR